MEIFKIFGIGIITCFLAIMVKSIKPEFYIFIVLAGSLLILFLVVKNINIIISNFSNILQRFNIDYSFFIVILKVLGIAYLTEFASSICLDTGNSSLADKIVLAGKVTVLYMSLPIITNLLNLIIEILP